MNRIFCISILAAFLAGPVYAQPRTLAILEGTVVDAGTGEPLPGAHVFIATSMMGTVTNEQGHYRLTNVPTGAHRLYVSMLGFEPDFRDIALRASRLYTFDFKLSETAIEVGEITVEGERDPNWQRRYEKFVRQFIGETPNAAETEIMNPEVLDLSAPRGALRAIAAEPLIIENRALGYRIQYFLREFESTITETKYDGEGLYEEMEPSSPEEAALWESRRRVAFMGSVRHFLLALLANRTDGQGFKTWSRPSTGGAPGGTFSGQTTLSDRRYPLDPASLLSPGEVDGEYILDFTGHVEVAFLGEEEDESYLHWSDRPEYSKSGVQTSWMRLGNGPTMVDYKGDALDPYGIVVMGYWAFERVGDELPKEYRPGQ